MERFLFVILACLAYGSTSLAQSVGSDQDSNNNEQVTDDADEAQGRRTPNLSTIRVIGERNNPTQTELSLMRLDENALDATALLRGAPGANLINNGPLSGQAQYRGMFGDRVAVRVDGIAIVPGGPNWMDAPLHYAPLQQLASLTVYRGIAPVSAGAETIGGTIVAETRQGEFTAGQGFDTRIRATSGFQGNGDVFTAGAFAAASNDSHRLHLAADHIDGDDREFSSADDATIAGTRAEKTDFAVAYGLRIGEHRFSVDYRRHETDDTGNPSLPADIRLIDTDLFKAAYQVALGAVDLDAQVTYQDVDHVMTNFELRPAPDFFVPPPGAPLPVQMAFGGTDRRLLDVVSETLGAAVGAEAPLAGGELELGFALLQSDHRTDVSDPDSAFFARPFPNVERNRFSGFIEWSGALPAQSELVTGLRITRVNTDADEAIAPPLPPAQALKDRFNAADRDRGDTLVDWAVQVRRALADGLSVYLGGARKARAPSYIERYAWLPIESTAGLADGNNHVGRLDLEPEVAHEINLGLDFGRARGYFSPQAFYRDVEDYIQGVPATDAAIIMVSTVNGDPTPLQYTNVGAEFFGADTDFGVAFTERLRLDGTVSYVRAKRSDIDDDIFRVAPLNGDLSLSYDAERWRVLARTVWAADQNKVSQTNDEPGSEGHIVLNLAAEARIGEALSLRAGVGNVFDNRHADHLAGFNRIIGSDVGGETAPPATRNNRIPGLGRNVFVRAELTL